MLVKKTMQKSNREDENISSTLSRASYDMSDVEPEENETTEECSGNEHGENQYQSALHATRRFDLIVPNSQFSTLLNTRFKHGPGPGWTDVFYDRFHKVVPT